MKTKLTLLIALLSLLAVAGKLPSATNGFRRVNFAEITISPMSHFRITETLGTNWTDHYLNETNRLGYVVTNTHAVVVYEGRTNQMLLKTEKSGIAVWKKVNYLLVTNSLYIPSMPYNHGVWITNRPATTDL